MPSVLPHVSFPSLISEFVKQFIVTEININTLFKLKNKFRPFLVESESSLTHLTNTNFVKGLYGTHFS